MKQAGTAEWIGPIVNRICIDLMTIYLFKSR